MSSPFDNLLSLSKLRQGHLRKSFEDSVDEEKRVDIGCETNSRWKRGELFWKAKGPMADTYKQIGPRIQAELNQARTGSYQDVGFSLFMVGETKTSAKPIIIIYSTDKRSRKAAKKAIRDRGILADTDLEVRTSKHPPSGRFKKVAMEDNSTPHILSFASLCEIFFDPEEEIRLVGMPIFIRHNAGPIRRATANAVYNGVHYGYITAAHALESSVTDDRSMENDSNLEISFDSDSDDEYNNGEETDILSQHSNTSPETPESGRSSRSLVEASLLHGSDVQQTKIHSLLPSDQSSLEDGSFASPDIAIIEPPSILQYRTLGNVSSIITPLDCGLVTVTETEVIAILEKLKASAKDAEAKDTVPVAEAKVANVIAWTSHGPIEGNLDDIPVFMRLRNSDLYELVYTFTYQQDGGIIMGDCGTLVSDADSGALYGHVIADSENTRLAYIMAAERTVCEIDRIGHWQLLASDDTQSVEERIKSPSPYRSIPIASRVSDSVPTASASQSDKLHSSSQTDSRIGSTETTPTVEKAEIPQANLETSPASLTESLRVGLTPKQPDKYSPHSTAAKEIPSLTIEATSSLFQAFASCIQGYELIVGAHPSWDHRASNRSSLEVYEPFSISLKLEELRLIDWARSVGLDYTDHELLLSPMIKKMIIGIMEEQQVLLSRFGREQLSETEEDFVIESCRFSEYRFSKIRFPQANHLFKKIEDFQSRVKKAPRTLVWPRFGSKAATAFFDKVAHLNNALEEALDEAQREKLYELQTRTSYQILLLNQNAKGLNSSLRLLEAVLYPGDKVITPSAIRHLIDLTHLKAMSRLIADSSGFDYIADPSRARIGIDRMKELSREDLFIIHSGPPLDTLNEKNIPIRTDALYKHIPVWIEWKLFYSGHTSLDSTNEERVKALAALLKAISESNENFLVPHCLGYFRHEARGLFGLVFQKPERASMEAPVTLHTLFNATDTNNDVEVPSLTNRITLMRLLCESVERLHAINWLHKCLCSTNILFFKDSDTNDITTTDPYISGLDYTSSPSMDSWAVRLKDSSVFHIYRHPSVRHSPRYFKMSHDIYALGLLLLEIAYWKPLDQILAIDLERFRPNDVYMIRDRLLNTDPKLLKHVKSHQGDVVENVIRICLEGPEAFDLGEDFNEESVEGKADLLRVFGEKVVMRLKEVTGL